MVITFPAVGFGDVLTGDPTFGVLAFRTLVSPILNVSIGLAAIVAANPLQWPATPGVTIQPPAHRDDVSWTVAEEPIKIHHLRKPVQCVLWDHPGRAAGKFSGFLDEVACYEDSSHLTRSLYKCRECGQLYFHEWYDGSIGKRATTRCTPRSYLFRPKQRLMHSRKPISSC